MRVVWKNMSEPAVAHEDLPWGSIVKFADPVGRCSAETNSLGRGVPGGTE